jgi:hypothetical protein
MIVGRWALLTFATFLALAIFKREGLTSYDPDLGSSFMIALALTMLSIAFGFKARVVR